ncbi:uncharacterized protein LOC106069317 [Biomphalaria glabrata]|uniref:Uncharacterized protein LOC106069317 n=1 Tax=Biomphalaria glabrata TaxID=6526 RepID=A0A9W3AQT3_BIOGL|nr:uncharacterized protein LOC106069317 [Biomphalaria glabrata]
MTQKCALFLFVILVYQVGIIFNGSSVLAQPQKQYVQFLVDSPYSVASDPVGHSISLNCNVYGELKYLWGLNTEISKMDDYGDKVVLFEDKKSYFPLAYQLDFYEFYDFSPTKLQIRSTILSVGTSDDMDFICQAKDFNGVVIEDTVKFVVYKSPSDIFCIKKNILNDIEVTCQASVYPQGLCNVQGNHPESIISNVKYDNYLESNGIYTTRCTVRISHYGENFHIVIYPDLKEGKNYTAHSEVITAAPSGVNLTFTVNKYNGNVVLNLQEPVEFKCNVKGTGVVPYGFLYFFKEDLIGNRMKLLSKKNAENTLEYKIDGVSCDHEGYYYCQLGYDSDTQEKISVTVKTCSAISDEKMSIIVVLATVGGLAFISGIIGIIVFIVGCPKHHKQQMQPMAGNKELVLTVPTAPSLEELETSPQINLPTYPVVCVKGSVPDEIPPPRPGLIGIIVSTVCCPKHHKQQMQSMAGNKELIMTVPTAPPLEEMETSSQQTYPVVCGKGSVPEEIPPPYPGLVTKSSPETEEHQDLGPEVEVPQQYTMK